MDGRTLAAKFCKRSCQVEHLRRVGPTRSGPGRGDVPRALVVRLDDVDRERLRQVADDAVVSPAKYVQLLVRSHLDSKIPRPARG